MTIDYSALANWGIVPALGILMAITVTLSYNIFYCKILEKENDVKNKVRTDVIAKIGQFNQITSQSQQGEQIFANEISMIAKFKEIVNDGKVSFKRDILISAIVLIVLGIVFIIWTEKQQLIFAFGLFSLVFHLSAWNSLRTNHDRIERFLNGDEPKDILGE